MSKATYEISSRVTGHCFGEYEATSALEAIHTMHADCGSDPSDWPLDELQVVHISRSGTYSSRQVVHPVVGDIRTG